MNLRQRMEIMNQLVRTKPQPVVDLFVGLSFSLTEIAKAVAEMAESVSAMRDCAEHRQEVSLKIALEDIARLSHQTHTLASVGAGAIATHVKRRARI